MTLDPALVGLIAAAALHAGFQVTVTVLAYPALARLSASEWQHGHDRHSRAIVALVVVVYAAVLATSVWAVASAPGAWVVAAVLAQAVALGVTATLAAPLHGRLTRRDDALVARLLRVDRVRAAAAVAGLVLAVTAVARG